MITKEAIEVAVSAFREAHNVAHKAWLEQPDAIGGSLEQNLRAALEAAAPHMLAAAWGEGAKAGFDVTREGFNGECVFMHCADDDYPPTNPYSGEKWEIEK